MTLRNQRRRRLLSDEPGAAEDEPIRLVEGTKSSSTAYPEAAKIERQRIGGLLPLSKLAIALCVSAGLVAIAAIELLHAWVDSPLCIFDAHETAGLNLNTPRNLSHWLASALLGAGGLTALFVFSLRRHRVDDYHARYRVWLWAAIGCVFASILETTDVPLLLHGVSRRIAEMSTVSTALVWRSAIAVLAAAAIGRMLVEVRAARLAIVALVLGAVGFLIAAAVDLSWVAIEDGYRALVERGAWLAGYVFLVAAFLCYARHVTREIEGLAVTPKRRKRADKAAKPSKDAEERPKTALHVRTDLDPVEKEAAAGPERLSIHTAVTKPAAKASAPQESPQNVSRAERRKQRRMAS